LAASDYDILVLTETWLNDKVLSTELFDNRYTVFRRDRERSGFHASKEGGGVLIAVSKKVNAKQIESWHSSCEDLWVILEVLLDGTLKRIALCAVYLLPPVGHRLLDGFLSNCNSIIEKFDGHVFLVGDFNLGNINWKLINGSSCNYQLSALGQKLIDFINVNHLNQYLVLP
jgi:hypothetical protein